MDILDGASSRSKIRFLIEIAENLRETGQRMENLGSDEELPRSTCASFTDTPRREKTFHVLQSTHGSPPSLFRIGERIAAGGDPGSLLHMVQSDDPIVETNGESGHAEFIAAGPWEALDMMA